METPAFPDNEHQRLDALYGLDVLDTPSELRFDRITQIAKKFFKTPISVVSLIDAERQWFKSIQGLEISETPREVSFCGHAIMSDNTFYVPDTLKDPRFYDNPMVTGSPYIRFYAGAAMSTPDGMKVGTLCIIDSRPRRFSKEKLSILRDLADCVENELERTHILKFNIEEIKQAERNQAHFAAIIGSSGDAIISKTLDGVIASWNVAAEKMFGYSAQEAIGQPMTMIIPKKYRDEEPDILRRIRASERIEHFETVRVKKDGDLIDISATISPIKDNTGKVIGVSKIARDITDRKQMDKMKTEFISTVSHELRTPLTSIKGSLGLIKSGAIGELPEKLSSMINIAYSNSDRLVRLINDILDIEKIAVGKIDLKMETLELLPLLEQAIVANKGYGEQCGVTFAISGNLHQATVKGDHDRLMQVMANLLSNAAKFSPGNGLVKISLSKKGNGFRVSVSDNGPGIPDEFHCKIFQRFAQADSSDTRQKGGTGLGLNIAREIIELHSGSLNFETKVGKGTIFYFDLPEWIEKNSQSSVLCGGMDSGRILICDDDPDVVAILRKTLGQNGLETDVAATVVQAKKMLQEYDYGAMTLDIGLPDQDGISLIRELRATAATMDLPIIIVSGRAAEAAGELNGNAIGIIDWLEKPIDEERLSLDIKRIIASSPKTGMCILHIEDNPDIAQIIKAVVGDMATVVTVGTLTQAKQLLTGENFDLVILDLALPDGDGGDILPLVNVSGEGATPVIIFSAKDVSNNIAESVNTALVKSMTSNDDLLKTICSAIGSRRHGKDIRNTGRGE